MATRALKDFAKRQIFRWFKIGERLGWHVVPVNYYSPLASIRELKATRDLWARPSSMAGIHVDLDAQVRLLGEVTKPYIAEVAGGAAYEKARQMGYGPGYGYIEAQVLHCVIRHFKPARMIEVGSGVSTACALRASELNAADPGGHPTRITCIEPYPSPALRQQAGVKLIDRIVQAVPVNVFDELQSGDMLFIDSTHVVKPGSDVTHLLLEVLPRIRPGVIVHVHDIYLPFQFGPFVLKQFFSANETSALQAYMAHNPRVETLFCQSHLFHERKAELKALLPDFDPQDIDPRTGLEPDSVPPFAIKPRHFPTAIYLRTR